MLSMKLREIEHTKIECARKFFFELAEKAAGEKVEYDMVDNYEKLRDVVCGRGVA